MQIISTLSEAEKAALTSRNSSYIGKVLINDKPEVFRSLQRRGLIGPAGGLTIRGSAVAEVLVADEFDELFG